MKKEYIKPISGMHSFRMKSNMLAGSFGGDLDGTGNGGNTGDGGILENDSKNSMWEYMEMEEE